MADAAKSNLEPIDESDLDLKGKFLGGNEIPKKETSPNEGGVEVVSVPTIEKIPEKKEGTAEREAAYSKILSKISNVTPLPETSDDDVKADAQGLSQTKEVEARVDNLVALAETKGIPYAVKVARHYEDNYLLDELHDRMLASDLHDALVKKGLIKEI